MKKDIIIIGCQRSGKTTLANMLIKDDNSYHNISLDSLAIAIKRTIPEIGISDGSTIKFISKRIVPFLVTYLKSYKCDYPDKYYLVEGIQINPDHLMREEFFQNANIICLGFPNATIHEIFSNIRNEDKNLRFSYTKTLSDDKLKDKISFYIEYSKFLQRKCNEYNIPFYETNKNRKQVLEMIYNNIMTNIIK